MRKLSLIAILCLISLDAYSKESPFNFLRNESSARAAGLSGAFVSIENDLSAVFYNPASIYTVEERNSSITFLKHVLDINSGQMSYTKDFEKIGRFAIGIAYTSYGTFDYADEKGNKPLTGSTFGANDLVLGVSYANELDTNFFYGLTLKYIYAGIENASTSAMAIDGGLLYKLRDGRTNLGLSILNAGFQLTKMGNETDNLPIDVRVGVNHRLRGLPLLINFSFHHLADETSNFGDRLKNISIGGEFYLGKYVQFRVGYDNQARSTLANETYKGLTGFSGGIGIKARDFNFDYGISKYGASSTLHRFSLSFEL